MKIGAGVMTLGMPVGLVVIILSFGVVGIYVKKLPLRHVDGSDRQETK